jgi:hypothetical protein
MADALNKTVEAFQGPGHQELKNTWAALKTIEKSVVHRTNVASRQATSGFFDLTEPFTYYHLAKGLLTGNPAELASAVVQKGATEYLKSQNNPNKYIKEMFQKADKIINGNSELRNTQLFAKSSPWSFPESSPWSPPYSEPTASPWFPPGYFNRGETNAQLGQDLKIYRPEKTLTSEGRFIPGIGKPPYRRRIE